MKNAQALNFPPLTPAQEADYRALAIGFQEAVDKANGSEERNDACITRLILMESFVRAVAGQTGHKPDDTLEAEIHGQITGKFLSVADHLDILVKKRREALQDAHTARGRDGVVEMLRKGGAAIVEAPHRYFVRTDPAHGGILRDEDAENPAEINRPAPKFYEILTAITTTSINGQNIYFDDLAVHLGGVKAGIVRDAPYDLIQIPRLNKEILVCDIIGEVILVGPLRGPAAYDDNFTKTQLKTILEMQPVTYKGDWQVRLLRLLSHDTPEVHTKIAVKPFAKTQATQSKAPLDHRIIAAALLDFALENQAKMANAGTEDPIPGHPKDTWKAWESAGKVGNRTLPEGLTLAALKRLYGWSDTKNREDKKKIGADMQHYCATGELPDPVMSIDDAIIVEKAPDLTPAILATALLDSALEHQGQIANGETKTPIPNRPNDTWGKLNKNGHTGKRKLPKGLTLAAVKRYYGWHDAYNREVQGKLSLDMQRYWATGQVPKPVLSIEEAVKVTTPSNLTPAIIATALLDFALIHQGKMAHGKTKDPIPGHSGDTWKAWESSGEQRSRTLPKGLTLAALKRHYGWLDRNNREVQEKISLDMQHYWTTGQLPKPVMSIAEAVQVKKAPDLTPAIIATALLDYAALHQGKMAHERIKDPIPNHPDDTWSALYIAGREGNRNLPEGMSLGVVKFMYGLDTTEGVQNALAYYAAHGHIPAPLMTTEAALANYVPQFGAKAKATPPVTVREPMGM